MNIDKKTIRSISAFVFGAGLVVGSASTARAATMYNVVGTQSISIDYVTGFDGGAILTETPRPVSFSGSWSFDSASLAFSGDIGFVPYRLALDMNPVGIQAVVVTDVASRTLHIDSVAPYYDPAQSKVKANSLQIGENISASCADGNSGLCGITPVAGGYRGNLAITFSPDFLAFTAVAYLYQPAGILDNSGACIAEGGENWCQNTTLTFSGTAAVSSIPIPAGAWLFGSGVLGLAGLKRRRAA